MTGCSTDQANVNETKANENAGEATWQVSPKFQIPLENREGSYTVRGIKGRIAFLDNHAKYESSLSAGIKNKNMWYFWGEEDELKGSFKVLATSKKTGEEMPIIDNGMTTSSNLADREYLSFMEFPHDGLWRLDAYMDDNLLGQIVVNVNKENIYK